MKTDVLLVSAIAGVVLAAGIGLAITASAQTADEPAYTPEGVVTVARCYAQCSELHARVANEIKHFPYTYNKGPHTDELHCRWERNLLNSVRRCEAACSEAWSALGKPPTKLRKALQVNLEADETAFDALRTCTGATVTRDEGIQIWS